MSVLSIFLLIAAAALISLFLAVGLMSMVCFENKMEKA